MLKTHLSACVLLFGGFAQAAESPGLGERLSAEAVAVQDFTILPNGDGLPTGSGDAGKGAPLYRQHCLACHGERGEGGPNGRLAGGVGSIGTDKPLKTVGSYWPYATTLFDYIRRAMPHQTPGIFSADELYSLTAYVLHLNGILDENQTVDARTLPEVGMPNRDGFVWAIPSD